MLKSLFNPLIFSRSFHSIVVEKKLFYKEFERKIFGPRQNGVTANVEQQENLTGCREDERQGNETILKQYSQHDSANTAERGISRNTSVERDIRDLQKALHFLQKHSVFGRGG